MIELSSDLKVRKSIDSILLSQAALVEAVKEIQQELLRPSKKYVHGVMGLADFFQCSRPTAQRILDSGRIDAAVSSFGHTIIIDSEMAVELLKNHPAQK
ncbi:MAG: DUF3853 family protein [Bacteroidales bacterium]|nr:DUF3853 family protein [Bacteroidales bacterium]